MSSNDMLQVIAGLANEAEALFPQLEQLAEFVHGTENEEAINNVQEITSYFAWIRARAVELSFDGT